MTHRIVSEHPRVAAVDQALADLADAEAKSKARVAALIEPYHEAVATWRRDADQAILAGDDPPAEPERPDLGRDEHAHHLFVRERQQLQARRKAVLADIADDVESAAADRERALLSEASELIDQLEPIRVELQQLLSALREVRRSQDVEAGRVPGRIDQMRSQVGTADLLALVDGGSVFDLAASSRQDEYPILRDDGPVTATSDDGVAVLSAPEPTYRNREAVDRMMNDLFGVAGGRSL